MRMLNIIEEIQEKIHKIQASNPEYSKIEVPSKHTAKVPEIGLWWWYNGEVLKYSIPYTESVDPDDLVSVDAEHIKLWPKFQLAYKDFHPDILQEKYDSIPRGRIWLRRSNGMFILTCSKEFYANDSAQKKIASEFGVPDKRLSVKVDTQYLK